MVVAQTERDEGERTGLYGRTITSDTYIVGESVIWEYPVANLGQESVSDVRLTVDLPPQFNVVQVQSGWFGSDEEWAIPTDVTLRYQTNEDDPNDPWREWVV